MNGSGKLLDTWPGSSAANVDLVSLESRSNLSGSDTICNCRVDIKLKYTSQLQLQSVLGFWLIVFPSLWSIPSVTERQRQTGQDGKNNSRTHSGPYLSPTGVTRMKRAFERESRLLTGRICNVRGAASHRLPLPSPSAGRRCFGFQLADAQQKEPCEEWRKDDALQARRLSRHRPFCPARSGIFSFRCILRLMIRRHLYHGSSRLSQQKLPAKCPLSGRIPCT